MVDDQEGWRRRFERIIPSERHLSQPIGMEMGRNLAQEMRQAWRASREQESEVGVILGRPEGGSRVLVRIAREKLTVRSSS